MVHEAGSRWSPHARPPALHFGRTHPPVFGELFQQLRYQHPLSSYPEGDKSPHHHGISDRSVNRTCPPAIFVNCPFWEVELSSTKPPILLQLTLISRFSCSWSLILLGVIFTPRSTLHTSFSFCRTLPPDLRRGFRSCWERGVCILKLCWLHFSTCPHVLILVLMFTSGWEISMNLLGFFTSSISLLPPHGQHLPPCIKGGDDVLISGLFSLSPVASNQKKYLGEDKVRAVIVPAFWRRGTPTSMPGVLPAAPPPPPPTRQAKHFSCAPYRHNHTRTGVHVHGHPAAAGRGQTSDGSAIIFPHNHIISRHWNAYIFYDL